MNKFLKTKDQVLESTQWLNDNGYISHPISCKDWELANVLKSMEEEGFGKDTLDMGADGSWVLHNTVNKNKNHRNVGIDLIEVTGGNKAEGAEYFKGDLTKTPFEDKSFDIIVSLSVIEHDVDVPKFASECSRLLRSGGKCYVSFDYFPEKIETKGKLLYNLNWNILDKYEAFLMASAFLSRGFRQTSEIDWTVQDAVINPAYCSPMQGISYTFGMFEFIKK